MRLRIDSRSYTNAILTVVAVFMCLLVLHAYRISVVSEARAQVVGPRPEPRIGTSGYSAPGSQAPIDFRNAELTRDVEVGAATREVAAANNKIAEALLEVADAIRSAGSGLGRPVAGATVIPPAPPMGGPLPARGSIPAGPTPSPESLNISVEPAL